MNINEKLKKIRLKHNMTKSEFAEIMGVSVRSIQRWEQGKAIIRESNLIKIGSYFEIPIEYFEEDNDE